MKNPAKKYTQLFEISKNVFFGFLTIVMIFSFTSCAKKISFMTSSVVPAARGYIEVKKDKNKNYGIQIHLSDLAEVERLEPSKKTYVVWLVTDENSTKNIGQIKSSTGMMSKKLKASFETVSPSKPTKVFITAEDDASIMFPGTQVVLSTDTFYK